MPWNPVPPHLMPLYPQPASPHAIPLPRGTALVAPMPCHAALHPCCPEAPIPSPSSHGVPRPPSSLLDGGDGKAEGFQVQKETQH